MCMHNGRDLLMCDDCAGEEDYRRWKRENPDRPCPHDVARSSCEICSKDVGLG